MEKITDKELEKIKPYYHHSAYNRKQDVNMDDSNYMQAYTGRFGTGIKVFIKHSVEIKYFIFK